MFRPHCIALVLHLGCGSIFADSTADTDVSSDTLPSETGGTDTLGAGGTPYVSCGESGSYIDLSHAGDITTIADCTHVLGTLRLGDTNFVTLSGLKSIKLIDESWLLFRNLELTSVRGLSGLEQVVGMVSIRLNSQLPSLEGLESLTRVGSLEIQYNDVLSGLDGLSGLQAVDGDVTILGNPLLSHAEAEAFSEGLSIGGTTRIEGNGE